MDYVKIIQSLIPRELEKNRNPLDLGKIEKFPTLKNIDLLSSE